MRSCLPPTTGEFIPTDPKLLYRLKRFDDAEGWQEFCVTYRAFIYRVASRAGLPHAEAEDVVQETLIAVSKKLVDFKYDAKGGSFKAWLNRIAKRRVIDSFRKEHYQVGQDRLPRACHLETDVIDNRPDSRSMRLEEVWEEEWQKTAIEAAARVVRATADPAEFQLFHLHVTEGKPAREVARLLKVKLSQVYFAKYKIGSMLRKQVKALQRDGY